MPQALLGACWLPGLCSGPSQFCFSVYLLAAFRDNGLI